MKEDMESFIKVSGDRSMSLLKSSRSKMEM